MARTIHSEYQDPLDCVWIAALRKLGIELRRSREVYASWDGVGTLTLAEREDFDPDDSLAQLIFHELCHLLVAGERGRGLLDWGLDNTDTRDLVFEHACHRVQAALAGAYGLREFMAVTTEWRDYWDTLPADPLAECEDPALPIARLAHARAEREPYATVLREALEQTSAIAQVVRACAPPRSLWSQTRPLHPSGFLQAREAGNTCGGCAWSYRRPGEARLRCRQTKSDAAPGAVVGTDLPACERWEPPFDDATCGRCGACCHRGFDLVQVSRLDPFRQRYGHLLQSDGRRAWLPRPDGRCVLLSGDGTAAPYRCDVYAERPRSCRLFEVAGDACLVARKRLGLREAAGGSC